MNIINISNYVTQYDETEKAAEYILTNAEVRCTKLEALKYIIAEHEYLDSIGFNIYSDYVSYSDKFDFDKMLDFISEKANLSKRKTRLFRKAEELYLRIRNYYGRNNNEEKY